MILLSPLQPFEPKLERLQRRLVTSADLGKISVAIARVKGMERLIGQHTNSALSVYADSSLCEADVHRLCGQPKEIIRFRGWLGHRYL